MGKHPKKKTGAIRKDDPMSGAMRLFLAGCAGEAYLLILRRFYINGHATLQIAWYDRYLWGLMAAGAIVTALGLLGRLRPGNHPVWRQVMGLTAGVGAFIAVVSGIVRWNMDTVSVLTVLLAAVMILGLLWTLYDRECAISLTILAITLLSLVALRRYGANLQYGLALKAALILYAGALVALSVLLRQGKLTQGSGRLGPLLSAKSDPKPVYLACGISCAAVAAALILSPLSYYVVWTLAAVLFALGVYYTVKQL